MAKAVVIYADGSKKMAHNLDDSQFRWHERKAAQAEANIADAEAIAAKPIHIRDCSEIQSVEEANRFFDELFAQKTALSQRLQIIRFESKNEKDYKRRSVKERIAYMESDGQLGNIRRYLRENNADHETPKVKHLFHRVVALEREVIQNQAVIIELQRILLEQFGITYVVPEFEDLINGYHAEPVQEDQGAV